MIQRLPHWVLTDHHPAFNDLESKTAIEMVARLYGKMQELVDSYNKYVDELNKAIEDFENGIIEDQETFQAHIDKIMHDYIMMLDEKIKQQDAKIDESIIAIANNLSEAVQNTINQMRESGELDEIIGNAFDSLAERMTSLETTISDDISKRIESLENENIKTKQSIKGLSKLVTKEQMDVVNHIIYDMSSSYYSQGICCSDDNKLYVAVYKSGDATSKILVFDLAEMTLDGEITVNMTHPGDMIAIGEYIYAIDSYSQNIYRIDVTSGAITTLSPFANYSYFPQAIGMSKIDDNNLICVLGHNRTGDNHIRRFENITTVKYEISTGNVTEYTINLNNFKFDFYCFQSVEYFDNKLYVLCSYPNMVVELQMEDTSFVVNRIYNIPERDILGQEIGEVEGISRIQSDYYGKNTFVLSSNILKYSGASHRTIKTYLFSFETELQNPLKQNGYVETANFRKELHLESGANPTIYHENGTEDFPFKDISRAISCSTHSKIFDSSIIYLHEGTYDAGRFDQVKFRMVNIGNKPVYINGDVKFYFSSFTIACSDVGNHCITFNGNLSVDSCFDFLLKTVIVKGKMSVGFSNGICQDVKSDYPGTDASVTVQASNLISDIYPFANNGYYYELKNGAHIRINSDIPDSKINKTVKTCWVTKST